jgi:deazaflavin-dependent oxidoreductase (nitroreductase family)
MAARVRTVRTCAFACLEASDVTIRVNPPGTRGARVPTALVKLIGRRQIRTYRRSGEQRVSSRAGFPVVLLTTRGAKTGRIRTAPVGGFPDGENTWLVAATIGGAARHPSWFLNMAKHPDDIWLEVGTERFKVRGESLEGQERAEALARIAKIAPSLWQIPRQDRSRDSYRAADPRA